MVLSLAIEDGFKQKSISNLIVLWTIETTWIKGSAKVCENFSLRVLSDIGKFSFAQKIWLGN